MVTINELYRYAGNPNLTHWKDTKILSLTEAGLLICAIDPIEYDFNSEQEVLDFLKQKKPVNWKYCMILIRSLKDAISTHELKSPEIHIHGYDDMEDIFFTRQIEQSRIGIGQEHTIACNKTKLHRDELKIWLVKKGYFAKKDSVTIANDLIKQQAAYKNPNQSFLQHTVYTTPALEVVRLVIQEFWQDYDPDGDLPPPKQEYVKQWIADNHPEIESNILREAIDKICRHPITKNGGNRKINP